MKILVCVDGSEHSFAAVEMAGSIASNLQVVEIAVLHVSLWRPRPRGNLI